MALKVPNSWAVIGGLVGMRPLNQQVKRALGSLYYYGVTKNRGEPTLAVAEGIPPPIEDPEALASAIAYYSRWSSSDGQTLSLYLMSSCGFFWLHMPSGIIAQALPYDKPHLITSLRAQFTAMRQALTLTEATQDDKSRLANFQLNCLLNMLLKDLFRILSAKRHQRQPEPLPDFLQQVVQSLSYEDTTASLDSLGNPTAEQRSKAKNFMNGKGDLLFFRPQEPPVEALVESAGKMGTIFRYVFKDTFVLFMESPETPTMPEAMLQSGRWVHRFQMRYTINM